MKNLIFTIFLLVFYAGVVAQNIETITGQISASGGVSVDKEGNIYVADFGISLSNPNGDKVHKITPDGTITTYADSLQGASGNVFDEHGNLFQANIGGSFISKIEPNGTVSTFVSLGIVNPVGLQFDTQGNLYVCNCGNNTIQKVTPAGVSTIFNSSPLLNCPNGITANGDTLYISNFGNGFVFKLLPNASLQLMGSIPGGRNGHLEFANNRLYVASHGSHKLYEMTLDGTVTAYAGTGIRGNADGSLSASTISVPNGVAASPTGDTLYFNCTIPSTTYPNVINPSEVRRVVGVWSVTTTEPIQKPTIKLALAPNPTQDVLNVTYDIEKTQLLSWKIFGIDGKLITTKNLGELSAIGHFSIDVSNLEKGIYLLYAEGEKFAINRRFIVF